MPAQDKSKVLGNRLGIKRLNNIDLNTITEIGEFEISVSLPNLNTPLNIADGYWHLSNWRVDNNPNYIMQTASIGNVTTNQFLNIYRRFCSNGTWSSWYQIAGSGLDMPSKKFIDIPKPTWQSGITYTAPANGYLLLNKIANDGNSYIEIFSLSYSNGWYSPQRYNMRCLFPLNKGETAKINTNITNTEWELYRFIYSNSEVPLNER